MRYSLSFVACVALTSACSREPAEQEQPEPSATDSDSPEPEPDTSSPTEDTGTPPIRELLAEDAALAVIHGVEEGQLFGARGALADLTGDGVADLAAYAAGRNQDQVFVLAGPLVGEIGSNEAIARVPYGQMAIGTGDLNGDGQQDLAVLSGPILDPYEFQLYFGPITGPLLQPDAIVEPEHKGDSGYVCDANGDGVDDLAFTYPLDAVRFALGPFPSGLMGEEVIDVVFEGDPVAFSPNPSNWLLCGRDVTGDGAPDLLLADYTAENQVWLLEDPVWDGWQAIKDVGDPMTISNYGGAFDLVGDLDEDGHPDLYIEEGVNGQLVTGPVSATSEPYATFAWGEYHGSTRDLGDLDGDGHDDLVIGITMNLGLNGAVFLFHGPLGAGTYEPADADLTIYGSEDAQFGYDMFDAGSSATWGVSAGFASGANSGEGHVFLYSGWPTP